MRDKIRIHTFRDEQELYYHISTLSVIDFHSIQLRDWKWERIRTEGNFKLIN